MILIYFVLGLIVGSFLNVLISRLHTAETILGRSKCPHCEAKIRWYDNIPLFSFAILGTRCRDCKEKISWQYPAVELATGIIFSLVGVYFLDTIDYLSWLHIFYYWIIFSMLLVIFVYDLRHMEIPMIVVWTGVGLTIIYLLFIDWAGFDSTAGLLSLNIFSGMLAGIAAFLFFFLLSAGSREKWMGMGDAYVALLMGLIVQWPGILIALVLAFTIGAIFGIILIALGKKTMQSQVPFAPFLVVGTLLTVIVPHVFPQVNLWFLYLQ
jgi:leader peptidase (prepilin peptidase) / N-methyltransferase